MQRDGAGRGTQHDRRRTALAGVIEMCDSNEAARFPTRREASAWLMARHREQRQREV